ncbi:hypothetical protein, partial [Sphingobium indicum]|uniref:hypothetical protein n=1 Tax=Sphingobium indicum TaxID=332055 RepID=UPI0035E59389
KIRSGQPAILELSFEDLAILDIGDRAQRKPEVITASVEWHLGSSNESVNRKMGFLGKFLRNQGIARSPGLCLVPVQAPGGGCRLKIAGLPPSREQAMRRISSGRA